MKKFITITLLLIICAAFKPVADKVYVCDSKESVAYHSTKECRGIKKCIHEIINVTKTEAVDVYKKRACKICY